MTRRFGSAAASAIEMRVAGGDLLGRRLVVRRRAADRRGDVGILQRQAVVGSLRRGDVGEAVRDASRASGNRLSRRP